MNISALVSYWAATDPYNGACFKTLIASLCFITVGYKYVHAKYFPRCLGMHKITDPGILEKKITSKSMMSLTNACYL